MAERDYTKFVRSDGTLNTRLIPRVTYVEMIRSYKRQLEVVEEVFEEQYWRWDLDQAAEKAASDGRDTDRVTLAQEIIGDMSDDDWWKITSAFEEHLIARFADEPLRWAEFLDAVYDLQEAEGWQDRQ